MYEHLSPQIFFRKINTERKAIQIVWRYKFGGKDFICSNCNNELYYEIKTRPEIRQCKSCGKQHRVRASSIFEHSKKPLLIWCRAIFYMMQGKRGISALELKRLLKMKSYGTTYNMLKKIREALRQRDEIYKLSGVIELDGAEFGRRKTENQKQVIIAVESKDWVDSKGKKKSKAGFAKVLVKRDPWTKAQELIDKGIMKGSLVNTDAGYTKLKNVDHDYQILDRDNTAAGRWLPWVHKFISNAKTWLKGTHHGTSKKTLENYLSEYTYRFNRRHDPDSLFSRALKACSSANPVTFSALSG